MSFEQRAEDVNAGTTVERGSSKTGQSEPRSPSDTDSSTDMRETDPISPSAERPNTESETESQSEKTLGFGQTGWLLTAALMSCTLLIPGVLYFFPYVMGSAGVTFFAAYIALPFVPALILGAIAVWSMTGATSDIR